MNDRDDSRFAAVGRDLFAMGAISTHGGNLSVRDGETLLITRTGAILGRLAAGDIVETTVSDLGDPRDARCSVELAVHRAIYARADSAAVIHAHGPGVIARSLLCATIVPVDSDARAQIGDVPVIEADETVGSERTGQLVAEHLRDRRIVVVRGHGSFARGSSLDDALQAVSCLDQGCRVLDLLDLLGGGNGI